MSLAPWYSMDYAGNQTIDTVKNHMRNNQRWTGSVYEEAKSEMDGCEEIQNVHKNIQYLMGKQWPDKRPIYKASPVANRTWSNLIQLVSFLTDIRQSFEIQANNKEYDKTAGKMNKMARAWFINQDVDMTIAMTIIYSALTTGYMRQVYDADANGGEGEIEVTPCGPLDVLPIKPSHKLQDAYGLIYEKPMPLSWFPEKYPMYGDLVPSDDEYSRYKLKKSSNPSPGTWNLANLGSAYRRVLGVGTSYKNMDSAIPMGRYREFWIRDNSRNGTQYDVYVGDMGKGTGYIVRPGNKIYPRGRLIIMGGPITLYDGPNPYWHGRFPFAALRINQVPWQWSGISEFRNQIPLQDIMNTILAGILDMVKIAVNPPMHAPLNAFSEAARKSLDPNMPGAKLFYNPGAGQPPGWAQTPNLPSFVFETMMYAREELTSQTGFLDASAVTSKKIIPSADTLESLSQGQQTLVRLKVRYIESFMREVGEQWIANSFQYYRKPRRILAYGINGIMWQDFEWNLKNEVKSPLDPQDHWRSYKWVVMPGSLLKSGNQEEREKAFALRRQGDMDRKTLYKVLDMESISEDVEKNLKLEGADILTNMLRQKMSGQGGGGGVSPEALEQLTMSHTGKPEPIN
jgi:hypothetical protein